MAFGFPARFTRKRGFRLGQDELAAAVQSALETLGWSYSVLPGGEFVASVHNSPFTFGEEIVAEVLPDGMVRVESRCVEGGMYRMPQIFDFGANRKNVETFFAQVEQTTGERSTPV